jgi:hypothetical protein
MPLNIRNEVFYTYTSCCSLPLPINMTPLIELMRLSA